MFRSTTRLLHRTTKPVISARSKNIELIQKATKDVESATSELRWLSQHVRQKYSHFSQDRKEAQLLKLCEERSRHVPLQYIIGSQPFGKLEMKCTPGVLIPRPETEAYTMYLSKILRESAIKANETSKVDQNAGSSFNTQNGRKLNILDLCSGSGCISLLLYETLRHHYPSLRVNGWDFSEIALQNTQHNMTHNVGLQTFEYDGTDDHIAFHQGDVFKPSSKLEHHLQEANIIISNPPYISEQQFQTETEESVRRYEPKIALVPDMAIAKRLFNDDSHVVRPEDIFYHQLVSYFSRLTKCVMMVTEVGDDGQAVRVAKMLIGQHKAETQNPVTIEIWRDWPEQEDPENKEKSINIEGTDVKIVGAGNMRAVVVFRGKNVVLKNLFDQVAASNSV